MTLETAKRIVNEGLPNKEAEAVVRGGMTICEEKADGNRKYQWIKVLPTKNDEESSIGMALEKYRNMKQKRSNTKKMESIPQEPKDISYASPIHNEDETHFLQSSFLERLKKEAKSFWEELDSIVVE
jgi:hypothetical protein